MYDIIYMICVRMSYKILTKFVVCTQFRYKSNDRDAPDEKSVTER